MACTSSTLLPLSCLGQQPKAALAAIRASGDGSECSRPGCGLNSHASEGHHGPADAVGSRSHCTACAATLFEWDLGCGLKLHPQHHAVPVTPARSTHCLPSIKQNLTHLLWLQDSQTARHSSRPHRGSVVLPMQLAHALRLMHKARIHRTGCSGPARR